MSCKRTVMPCFRMVLLIHLCVLCSAVVAQTNAKVNCRAKGWHARLARSDNLPEYKVLFVSDYDHVMLHKDGETLKVGLLGVEALPVTSDQSSKAAKKVTSAFLKTLFNDATVRVEFGTGNNRARVYLYRSSDTTLLNQEVIEEGFGVSSKKVKHRLRDDFDRREQLARAVKKGL